jgi:EAL domain-containing protein (putative c-di-GMP-specific phosphodiesterase class I)/FixJ family two-component response regulator
MKTTLPELQILIVDDSAVQREFAQMHCNKLGIVNIFCAANGLESLEILQANTIDAVLIDLEMPVMDGVELIHAIAQNKLTPQIIILSAKDPILISSVGTMAEAEGLTVLGTFKKPVQPEMLQCSFLNLLFNLNAIQHSDVSNQNQVAVSVNGLELSQAISDQQVLLAYQPKLTVQGLRLCGVEALARWRHPEKGLIPPGVFIPLAERLGLINTLTQNLLLQALAQKRVWQQMGFNFHLAFNLSPYSIADVGFADWIVATVTAHQVPPQEITFEITENALLNELASAIRTLARLRLKGFNLAIDDYGTGFANAQQLSRVPATELKLDRSLVHRAAQRPQQLTILTSSTELGKNLHLTLVAEGVETREDYDILIGLGVDQVQGYYFSKPLWPDDLLRFIKVGLGQIRNNIKLA